MYHSLIELSLPANTHCMLIVLTTMLCAIWEQERGLTKYRQSRLAAERGVEEAMALQQTLQLLSLEHGAW